MARIWLTLIVVIDVLAILDVWKQESSNERKLLWIIAILFMPILGPLAWYAISRKVINL
jgi:hypothetical protein